MEYTKGEWQADFTQARPLVTDEKARIVCEMPTGANEDWANAQLISATPNLYEALKLARDNIQPDRWPAIAATVDMALAKAEGR